MICEAGHDGGLQQHFMLEVSQFDSSPISNSIETKTDIYQEEVSRFKVLGAEPEFVLKGLESGTLYNLAVYAINSMGRSEPPVVISGVRFGSSSARLTSTGKWRVLCTKASFFFLYKTKNEQTQMF